MRSEEELTLGMLQRREAQKKKAPPAEHGKVWICMDALCQESLTEAELHSEGRLEKQALQGRHE